MSKKDRARGRTDGKGPRLLTDHRYATAFLNSEVSIVLQEIREGEGRSAHVPLDVVYWACRECDRQNSGELSVGWLLNAWLYSLGRRHELIDLRHVLLLGRLVEPEDNDAGVRWGAVSVGWEGKMPAAEVPRALAALIAELDHLDPERGYREFEEIHPFWDGNGRVGSLLWNWLNGTLERPEHPPDFLDPEGYWARVRAEERDDTFAG